MIFKSYIIENNDEVFSHKIFLFYGENLGLKKHFKEKIKKNFKKFEKIIYFQDEILKNKKNFINEFNNISLFEKTKIFLINDVSDKILDILEEIDQIPTDNKIYLFIFLLLSDN